MAPTITVANSQEAPTVEVPPNDAVRVYRVPDKDHQVVAKCGEEEIDLGIHDASVSREFDDEDEAGYIEFLCEDDGLIIVNHGASWETTIKSSSSEDTLSTNERFHAQENCHVEVGHATKLKVDVQ